MTKLKPINSFSSLKEYKLALKQIQDFIALKSNMKVRDYIKLLEKVELYEKSQFGKITNKITKTKKSK